MTFDTDMMFTYIFVPHSAKSSNNDPYLEDISIVQLWVTRERR